MKAKVEKAFKIGDGKHEGKIKELQERTKPFHYIDIVITEKEFNLDLKCGVPFSITDNTKLGRILTNFGCALEEGREIEIEKFLKEGEAVEFETITEETDKGTFSRIKPSTLKPKK